MNYIASLQALFQSSEHRLSERSKILDMEFNFSVDLLPDYDQIAELIQSFPDRDIVGVSLTNENDDIFYLSSTDLSAKSKYDSFKDECEYSEQISAKISINKDIKNGLIYIYSFSSFSEELCDLSLDGVMTTFSALLNESSQLIFEVFDTDILFKTKTMLFSSAPQRVVFQNFDRKSRLNACSEGTHFYDQPRYQLLPDDFQIDIDFEGNPLSETFIKLSNIFSLIYLSSSASLHEEVLELHIAGQRTLEFKCQCALITSNPELYKIYNWIYTDGNATDKSLIARNILCLHCRFSDIQRIDGKTFASIQSNYNLYLKDNVAQYIQLTNKLSEFISDVVSKTGDYAISILDKFKNNLFAILGFLFTVILANIVSDQPLNNIFTRDIVFILEAVLFGSIIYLVICVLETKYKIRKIHDSYDALKQNYSSILTPDDINMVFDNDKIMTEMSSEVDRGICRYACLWGAFILVSLIAVEMISEEPIIRPLLQQLFAMIKSSIN